MIHADTIKPAVPQWFGAFFFAVMALAILASALNGGFTDHLRASAFFIYNMIIGYATFLGLTKMGARRVEHAFFWFAVVLIVGAALEVYGPIRPVSDWFRHTFDSWHGVYEGDIRDLTNYGAVRPKFFASEPSGLGGTTAFCLTLWLGARRRFDIPFLVQAICVIGAALF